MLQCATTVLRGGTLACSLLLGACGSSDGDPSSALPGNPSGALPSDQSAVLPGDSPDPRLFAGLWNASAYYTDGGFDERYASISEDGRYTEYDYRQDDFSSDGNCYVVTELSLRPIGLRKDQPPVDVAGLGFFPEVEMTVDDAAFPAYRLADGRTVSFFTLASQFDEAELARMFQSTSGDLSGAVSDEGSLLDDLFVGFGPGPDVPHVAWTPVEGRSADDLEPCDASSSPSPTR